MKLSVWDLGSLIWGARIIRIYFIFVFSLFKLIRCLLINFNIISRSVLIFYFCSIFKILLLILFIVRIVTNIIFRSYLNRNWLFMFWLHILNRFLGRQWLLFFFILFIFNNFWYLLIICIGLSIFISFISFIFTIKTWTNSSQSIIINDLLLGSLILFIFILDSLFRRFTRSL